MKKVILSFAVLAVSFSALSTPFQSTELIISSVVLQDDFVEIKVEEVPEAITKALKVKYPNAVIEKAYVTADKLYKLDITIGNLKEILLSQENGNWVQ